ncbi:hypothetical protein RGU76_30100 [Bacillus pseudomycoides]|uniref:hypothetical protein n=1 Tax=Bacillus sp. DHT2 TaxID=2994532 RepID=UPI00224991FC|nr:hypothetical protein [Bacillus sp. DHT2]MDR4919050.1 hypothetical protein [Bacillus pseudomycoides]
MRKKKKAKSIQNLAFFFGVHVNNNLNPLLFFKCNCILSYFKRFVVIFLTYQKIAGEYLEQSLAYDIAP